VAGTFYPDDPETLRRAVAAYLETAQPPSGPPVKAAIVPHAGYVYSGPIAATAYARLAELRGVARRVVLLGPAHRAPVEGLAIPTADAFDTPLGRVPIDRDALEQARSLPQVFELDAAHAAEHSLEVQLPFLQESLGSFALAPFAIGNTQGEEVARLLDLLWGGRETLVVISSDLSHYLDYETAGRRDRATARAIEEQRPEQIGYDDACGRDGIRGLLHAAATRSLEIRTVDLRNSGDTAGPRDRVVGYGSFLAFEPGTGAQRTQTSAV
jgi:AmmeMemoRadiSam system protein B